MKTIDSVSWSTYKISDLFEIKRPMGRSQLTYERGNVPYIASGNYNNGVLSYLSPKTNETLDKGNCISVSPIDGSAFYQPIDFMGRGGAGSSIVLLYNAHLNMYNGLFIATMIHKACSKYIYNNMGGKDAISKESISLPSDKNGEPDYKYMENYMKCIEILANKTLRNLIEIGTRDIANINVSKWGGVTVGDLFPNITKPLVYHTREVHQDPHGIPYIVRSKFNNGIKYRVTRPQGRVNPPNVISFGAENATFFYQKEEWISGRDIYFIDTREIDEYACLFIVTCLQQIADKYSYNYGLFPELLKKEKIKLPTDKEGNPDFTQMSNRMKALEVLSRHKICVCSELL